MLRVGAGSQAEERGPARGSGLSFHLAVRWSHGDGLHRGLAAGQVLGVRKLILDAEWFWRQGGQRGGK